jgi:hypothetical protein
MTFSTSSTRPEEARQVAARSERDERVIVASDPLKVELAAEVAPYEKPIVIEIRCYTVAFAARWIRNPV